MLDHAVVWPLVCALPERQRAVVVLRYYEDLTEAETAQVLGCAVGTVKAHAHHALRALRAQPRCRHAGGGCRAMSLEQRLRTVLAEYAERPEVPRPDFEALTAGGLSLRRRRHQIVGAT